MSYANRKVARIDSFLTVINLSRFVSMLEGFCDNISSKVRIRIWKRKLENQK